MLGDDPNAFSHLGSSSTTPAADIPKATTLQGLIEALDPVQGWEYEPEQSVDMRKARAHVGEGPYRMDAHVLTAFFVGAINEWGMEQPRVLLLSTTAYYRVKVEGGNVSVVRVPLEKLTRLEATRGTLRVTALEPLADAAAGRWLSSATAVSRVAASLFEEIRTGVRPPPDTSEFESTREYRPYAQLLPAEAIAALGAALSKAAELANGVEEARGRAGFKWPRMEGLENLHVPTAASSVAR